MSSSITEKSYGSLKEFLSDLEGRIARIRELIAYYLRRVDELNKAVRREETLRSYLLKYGIRLPQPPKTAILEITDDSSIIIETNPKDIIPIYEEVSDKLQQTLDKLAQIAEIMKNIQNIEAPIQVLYENEIPKYIIINLRKVEKKQ